MNLFKIMQSIRAMAQAGKIDFPGAIVYLQKLGVKMDGIVHQALKNVFKEGKARDIDFGNVVKDFPIDDAGIPFNPKTLKSTAEKRNIESLGKDATPLSKSIQEFFDAPKEKRGVENLFKNKSKTLADELSEAEGVETFETILPTKSLKEPKYGKLDYDRIAKMEGVDVEEIRGKTVKEIIEYLAMIQKKDGGRIGFEVGGLSDRAQAIYDSWIAAGHTEEDVLAYLTSQGLYGDQEATGIETIVNTAPAVGGGGDNIDYFGPDAITKEFDFQRKGYLEGPLDERQGNKGWLDVTETGYLTPAGWKTKDRKNIFHAGIFQDEDKIGTIKKTPIDWSGIPMGAWGLGMQAFKGMKDYFTDQKVKSDINKAKKIQKMLDIENAAKAAAIPTWHGVAAGSGATYGPGETPGGAGENVRSSSGDVYGGATRGGWNEAAEKTDFYKKGGLATMFIRRR